VTKVFHEPHGLTGQCWSPFLAVSQSPVYTLRPWIQLLVVHIAPTHREMARLSWPQQLVVCWDSLPTSRQSPIPVLTWLTI